MALFTPSINEYIEIHTKLHARASTRTPFRIIPAHLPTDGEPTTHQVLTHTSTHTQIRTDTHINHPLYKVWRSSGCLIIPIIVWRLTTHTTYSTFFAYILIKYRMQQNLIAHRRSLLLSAGAVSKSSGAFLRHTVQLCLLCFLDKWDYIFLI